MAFKCPLWFCDVGCESLRSPQSSKDSTIDVKGFVVVLMFLMFLCLFDCLFSTFLPKFFPLGICLYHYAKIPFYKDPQVTSQ